LGDALGIGDGIIRWCGGLGNAVQVAATDAVAAFGIGTAVRDTAITDRAADRLSADSLFRGGLVDVDLGIEMCSD
jgi:hypothetical protein